MIPDSRLHFSHPTCIISKTSSSMSVYFCRIDPKYVKFSLIGNSSLPSLTQTIYSVFILLIPKPLTSKFSRQDSPYIVSSIKTMLFANNIHQGDICASTSLTLGLTDRIYWRDIMAGAVKQLELKFRIFDGTDIGHGTYSPSITAATLKHRLLSQWPRDKSIIPKSVNDMKLIHAGRFLENGKTLADSKLQVGNVSGGVITLHAVVQPPVAKRKIDKKQAKKQKQGSCSCVIL